MFEVSSEQQQYTTYRLIDRSSAALLEVVPERGGIITRWQIHNQELLYLDQERFSHPELSVRGGIPILFPICGNLPNNTYTYRSASYSLKQHGFARDLPWEVVDQSTQAAASITLALTDNPQTQSVYPFAFQLRLIYQLQGRSLVLQQQVTNRSQNTMPFSIGLHPYFAVIDKTQLHFDLPATQFQDQRTQAEHAFWGQFDFEQDEIDVAFRPLSGSSARVVDQQRQLDLTLDYDSTYSTLVFWTIKGKDYYCLEPWSAPRNALNSGADLIELKPGATWEAKVKLTARF